ncbi:YqkE family protein [Bacillus sp. DJP31]|uniref:YqkE family protein n=1 Tax=Bacillus sp. DJP31 TaxID=3409789 RepID=UPI003BB6A1F0
MAKKKTQPKPAKKEDDKVLLKDRLNGDVFEKLKEKQRFLKEKEQQKQEAELSKKREEARLREKNKSFEELLNESTFDWKKYE